MKKRLILMLCALPLVGVILWFIAGKNTGNLLPFGIMLACPLLHLFMGHGGHNHNQHHQKTKKV